MISTTVGASVQFSKLIDPVDLDEFIGRDYEQRPLYIHRDNSDYFANLLTADDIDRLFDCEALARSILRVNKEGSEIHQDQFSASHDGVRLDRVSNARLLKLFEGGHTIIINTGNLVFPNLDRYCCELERELHFRVQPNIYITPFSAQGFNTHYDNHDVFILQVMGSKNWRVFHAPVELPSKRQSFVPGTTYPLEAPQLEVTLTPGDTLYIPRGFLHDAATDGTTSAHITLGLHPPHRFDLLEELTRVAQDNPEFRKSIPVGLLADRSATVAELKRMLTDLVDTTDVDDLLTRRHRTFVEYRHLDTRGRFKDLARLNKVTLNTVVRRRPSVLYTLERDDQSLTVVFSGNRIPVQPFLEEALQSLLGDQLIAVRDIPGFLTNTARLELANRLLKTGFLEIVDLNTE
jgi:ribosomal protein L16 Arg81 hydroxylase